MSFDPSFFTGAGAPRVGQQRNSSGSELATERTTRRASIADAGLSSRDVTEVADLLLRQAGMAPPAGPFSAVPTGLLSIPTMPVQPVVSAPASRRQSAVLDWPGGEVGIENMSSSSEELLAALTNAMFSLGSPSCSAESNALTTQASLYPSSDLSATASGLDTASAFLGYLQSPPAITKPTCSRMQPAALASSLTRPIPCTNLQPAAQAGPSSSSSSSSAGSSSTGRLAAGPALHTLRSQATAARARRLSWQPELPSTSAASPCPAGQSLLPPSSSLLSSVISVAEEEPAQVLSPRSPHPLYKTELCKSWDLAGECRYGDKCQFAHGAEELRLVRRHPKYRTKVCHSFMLTGSCPYGHRCRFIHGSDPGGVASNP